MDAFGGANEGDKMRTALEKKLSDLKDRYQGQPPKKKHATQWRSPPQEVRRDLSDRGGRGRETMHPQPGPGRERLRRGNRQSSRSRASDLGPASEEARSRYPEGTSQNPDCRGS